MPSGRGGGDPHTHTNLSSSTPRGSPGGRRRRQTQESKKIAGALPLSHQGEVAARILTDPAQGLGFFFFVF